MPPKFPKNASDNLNTKKDLRCCWTDADDVIVVQILRQQKEAGSQSGAGWKSQVWTAAIAVNAKILPRKFFFSRFCVRDSHEQRL